MNSDGSNQTYIGSGFHYPTGVAVDASGQVLVVDNGNSRIVKMNSDGSNQTDIGSGFYGPTGVEVDAAGFIFVADNGNDRIVKMNSDGSNPVVIGSGFRYPSDVAVDASGQVFVADYGNDRIVKMNSDGSNQNVVGSGFWYPTSVAVDASGHVFVADYQNNRVVKMNAGFTIADQTIPTVQAGQPLASTQLVAALVDPSTPPKVTSVKWFASSLPAGLKLSSTGVLSGTPLAALDAGIYSIYVTATERITTKIGKVTTVTTKTTSRVFQINIT
jgi:streptogramin lyase